MVDMEGRGRGRGGGSWEGGGGGRERERGVQRETRKGPGRRGGVAWGIGFEVAVEKGSGGRI